MCCSLEGPYKGAPCPNPSPQDQLADDPRVESKILKANAKLHMAFQKACLGTCFLERSTVLEQKRTWQTGSS